MDTGGTARLAALITEDVELSQDTGGKVPARVHTLRGRAPVLEFIGSFLHQVWQPYRWTIADLNGGRGALLSRNGRAEAALSFAYDEEGQVRGIYIVRNPDKLARLGSDEAASK